MMSLCINLSVIATKGGTQVFTHQLHGQRGANQQKRHRWSKAADYVKALLNYSRNGDCHG
jgi:hypothetical protein